MDNKLRTKELQVYQNNLCEHAFTYNVAILKQYGKHFKISQLAMIRNAGVEFPHSPKNSVNENKLDNNICRARSKIREYGFCNDWDYFMTQTLRPNGNDRFDLKLFQRSFSQMVRDLRKKTGAEIRYLIVPERHKNGAWHLHGLLAGIPPDLLECFTLDQHLPYYIRRKLLKGEEIYNCPIFAEHFGYVTIEPLRDKDKAVSYITKYITKNLAKSVSEMGAHMFYASKGLQHARELERGALNTPIPVDFAGEYCAITWFDGNDVDAAALRNLFYHPRETEEVENNED